MVWDMSKNIATVVTTLLVGATLFASQVAYAASPEDKKPKTPVRYRTSIEFLQKIRPPIIHNRDHRLPPDGCAGYHREIYGGGPNRSTSGSIYPAPNPADQYK
jgi:hypothetical protein